MIQPIKYLLYSHDNLDLIPNTHIKSRPMGHVPGIPGLRSQRHEDCNGLLVVLDKALIFWFSEGACLKK